MPQAAVAYVGPGAGLTAIGTMIALIAALLLALMGFVWYPVKRMLRARKAESARPEVTSRPRVTSRAEVTSAQDR
jgi:flagellar biogenesis protein FliO